MIGYWHDSEDDTPSSISLSAMKCIVAKRHILQQKCLLNMKCPLGTRF